jgi:hypothetical protein
MYTYTAYRAFHNVLRDYKNLLLKKKSRTHICETCTNRRILSVALYGCETWSLTLKEECRLRVFENRVLRRIFESKRDEITGGMEKII